MAWEREHIQWFRGSSPYIDAHRGRTFVVYLGGDLLASEQLANVAADLALLHSLGVRLALVHGARPQIDAELKRRKLATGWQETFRITPPEVIDILAGVVGVARARLEAELGRAAPDILRKGRAITTVSGNFIRARPLGVLDGTDHLNTGVCRKVNDQAIHKQLEQGSVVIISPLGYSPSGEIFNLESSALAGDVAVGLGADKLLYLTDAMDVLDTEGRLVSEIDLSAPPSLAANTPPYVQQLLAHCRKACQAGVERCHLISYAKDGALLQELFTTDGCGTQVTGRSYEQVRDAGTDDVAGILKLIEPLEKSGVLVKRSRELLESEIDKFIVIERDGLLISCAALYSFGDCGELACLVTHPDYRQGSRGDVLLEAIDKRAQAAGLAKLFVLTTQSADWFRERGFAKLPLSALPESKQGFYNYQRNAKVLAREVQAAR